jgi:hypothetical protein
MENVCDMNFNQSLFFSHRQPEPTAEDTQRQTAIDLARLYRQRRHISQEDTISHASTEDLTSNRGRVEQPAAIQVC